LIHQPHDKLAKVVIERLAEGREVAYESEMWPDLRGDVVVHAGQPLPSFTGLLGALLNPGTALLEFYHGRPTAPELLHGMAKGNLLFARELEQASKAMPSPTTEVIVVTIGHPKKAIGLAYGDELWVQRGPGHWERGGPQRHTLLDLRRLRVDLETAWLHVAGNGPKLEEALAILMDSDYNEMEGLLEQLREEVAFMPSVREAIPVRRDKSGALRFLTALERAAVKREGRQEGRQEGWQEGALKEARRMAVILLSDHLDVTLSAVAAIVDGLTAPDQVECLLKEGLRVHTLEAVSAIAERLLDPQQP